MYFLTSVSRHTRLLQQSSIIGSSSSVVQTRGIKTLTSSAVMLEGKEEPKRNNTILPGVNRIILVRHGESAGNKDETAYAHTADWRIPLTTLGREQARLAGEEVASYINSENVTSTSIIAKRDGSGKLIQTTDVLKKGKVFFYVSPYLRTKQTLREILRVVDPECIVGIREDPRM